MVEDPYKNESIYPDCIAHLVGKEKENINSHDKTNDTH
jgi:hypothetical protein